MKPPVTRAFGKDAKPTRDKRSGLFWTVVFGSGLAVTLVVAGIAQRNHELLSDESHKATVEFISKAADTKTK